MTSAIDQLYRDHGHVVLRRARSLLRSDSEARDAVQDIFLDLLRRPEQLDGVVKITGWLYRTTTHHCLNKLRDQRGRVRILDAFQPPASVAPRSEAFAQVRALLNRLPEPLGEVAIYHHLDGMTYDEIAALLGCSRRQVGYLIERLHAAVADDDRVVASWPKEQES
jgi:RNA polymerase sigma-70 factor (ECF subfamily)